MIDARFVPVEAWPGDPRKPYQRKASPFRGSWKNTLDTLELELGHLKAKDILVQAYLTLDDIRNDGWPRSAARPSQPGVVVSFRTLDGDLSFPCDTYNDWQDNLRAIALALSALRTVERYGVTRRSEQYKGWAKLPPAPKRMSKEDALTFFGLHGGAPTSETFKSAYRSAAAKLHPDNQSTGNEHLFRLLSEAKEVLAESYGWSS